MKNHKPSRLTDFDIKYPLYLYFSGKLVWKSRSCERLKKKYEHLHDLHAFKDSKK